MITNLIIASILGYLLGSIPVGYIVGRLHGIDIRKHGSGNIGATNVVRVLGKKPGYFVFLCDAMKGVLAVFLTRFVASQIVQATIRDLAAQGHNPRLIAEYTADLPLFLPIVGIVGALACILGHNFPVWLRFHGGKGVATTIGTLLGLMPLAFLVVAVVWLITFFTSRYVSVASILAATILPVAVWVLHAARPAPSDAPMLWFSIVAATLVWWRHRGNIQRLVAGTEPRFDRKKKADAAAQATAADPSKPAPESDGSSQSSSQP